MEKEIIKVEGMSCEHCVNAITKALKQLTGIKNVKVNLKDKEVLVEYISETISLSTIKTEIENQGYDVI